MMKRSKITVVTVCYNSEDYIETTIKSVLSQNYDNLEYIVIDGGSKDTTMDIVNKYVDKISLIVSEPDNGIYDAMNKGLNKASGDWIFFLNTGDVFYNNDTIQKISFDEYLNNENVAAIVGHINVCKNGKIYERKRGIPFYQNTKTFKNMGFSHQGVFVKTRIARLNGFDMRYKLCADYAMMTSIYNKGYKFILTEIPISIIYGDAGASASNRALQMKEEAKVCNCENNFHFKLIYYYRLFKLYVKRMIGK